MSIYSEPVSGPETGTLAEGRDDPEDIREWKEGGGKSSSLQHSPLVVENFDGVGNLASTIDRLRQAEIEEEAVYELKRLELERRVSKARRQAEISELEAKMVKGVEGGGGNVVVRNSVNIHRPVTDPVTSYSLPAIQPSLSDILCRLDLPKLELPSFSGDQLGYWNFMRQFEAQVENRVTDAGTRLCYLINCCRGRARRLIEGCAVLPATEGYSSAKGILAEMFGRPCSVARALIHEVVHGKVIRDSADDLIEFAIKIQNCELALRHLGREDELNSVSNMEGMVKRLPTDLQRRWIERATDIGDENREPNFHDVRTFIERRARVANSVYSQLLGFHAGMGKTGSYSSIIKNTPTEKCSLCNLHHGLVECEKFMAMNASERWSYIARLNRCFVCLDDGHVAATCPRKTRCPVVGCDKTHHRLLHSVVAKAMNETVSLNGQLCDSKSSSVRRVCMGIIPVRLVGPGGSQITYALLDNGSDATLIDGELARALGLQGDTTALKLHSVNAVREVNTKRVRFLVQSIDRSGSAHVETAYAVENLSIGAGCFPRQDELDRWAHLRDLKFERLENTHIGILIGCDVPEVHWSIEERLGTRKQPFAKRTVLGWILLGPLNKELGDRASSNNTSARHVEELLDRLYDAEFRDIDDGVTYSVEDRAAMLQVSDSAKLVNGHFEIGLPWRKDKHELPNNWTTANRRLYQLGRRLGREPGLREAYQIVMKRHIDCGYIVPVPDHQLRGGYLPRWYLPHHAVINPKKPGKVRVVFDCAARHLGVSLNDYLLQGPNLTTSLVEVLLRFREGRVAMTSDIEEMFLQVRVPQEDRGALRLLWWNGGSNDGDVMEWQMAVHPFGATSSPFCAAMALRKSSEVSNLNDDSPVREFIERNFYVDDCLISLDSATEASRLANELTDVVNLAGFRLTRWSSNEPSALNGLHVEELSDAIRNMTLGNDLIERTLGLEWDVSNDQFRFLVKLPDRPATRRGILSCVSSLYDPLGLVAPILLPAKTLLQSFCRQSLGWDDEISETDLKLWRDWLGSLSNLRELRIPRCTRPADSAVGSPPELHIFSDASEIGYGIACYARYQVGGESFRCSLLMGKCRVAPLKSVSIPRLELTAATLAVKTASLLHRTLRNKLSRIVYWTDSMTVLYYITNRTSRYSTFVSNRLAIIHGSTKPDQWRYVKSELNPADYASRGIRPEESKFGVWVNGPDFLCSRGAESSCDSVPYDPPSGCEFKAKHVFTSTLVGINQLDKILTRYSDWLRLLRAIVWLTRFKTYLNIMKGKRDNVRLAVGNIKVTEIRQATIDVIRMVQRQALGEEYVAICSGGIHGKGGLRRLNPFSHDGILLVGGRLANSRLSEYGKHPMILPSRHVVTDLLIKHYHEIEGHVGPQHILAQIRKKFWVLKGISNIKRVIYKCLKCRRLRGQLNGQLMAPLPASRVTPGQYPFESTGVDYFGPLYAKQGRATVKRYGCLFTCLKTRAVHIEIAQSLSTDSFMMAVNRFVNRRGSPNEIFSDNGSNFVGAEVELRSSLEKLEGSDIGDRLLARDIQWSFNPPGASHRGGVWERVVRSIKEIARALSVEQVMNDEVMLTLMTEVERIVNNRPLVPVYDDADDIVAITPNDILILRPVSELNANELTNLDQYTRGWRQAKHLADTFWRRWIRIYLPSLQTRSKWFRKTRNLKPGDVVIIASDVLNRSHWPLGRVTAVHPSTDGIVRKVTLKTKAGEVLRDIRRLCLLEGVDEYGCQGSNQTTRE